VVVVVPSSRVLLKLVPPGLYTKLLPLKLLLLNELPPGSKTRLLLMLQLPGLYMKVLLVSALLIALCSELMPLLSSGLPLGSKTMLKLIL
jgi:hypothetical protein